VAELGGKLWAGQCKIKVQKNVLKHTSLLNISALVTDQRSYTNIDYWQDNHPLFFSKQYRFFSELSSP
jgi:hypothetical protein